MLYNIMIDLTEVLGHKYLMFNIQIIEFMNINENCKKWEESHGKIWGVHTKSFVPGLLIFFFFFFFDSVLRPFQAFLLISRRINR